MAIGLSIALGLSIVDCRLLIDPVRYMPYNIDTNGTIISRGEVAYQSTIINHQSSIQRLPIVDPVRKPTLLHSVSNKVRFSNGVD
ncbi:hypothetical protein FJZ31_05865 [Candidatus Poribacteria bacterium]|nr:hypothetical protein [Candidatus Poribacteria bacterium]